MMQRMDSGKSPEKDDRKKIVEGVAASFRCSLICIAGSMDLWICTFIAAASIAWEWRYWIHKYYT